MHVFCLVRVTAPIVPDSTNKSTLCRNFFVKRKDKLALFTKMTGHCWGGLIMCPHNGRTPALISSVSAFQKHWLTLCTSGNLSSARRITYYRSMRRSLQFQLGEEWWMNFSRVIIWSSRLINDIKGFKLFVFHVQFFIVDQAACPRCSKFVNLYMVVNQVGHSAELLKKVLLRRRNSFLIKRFTFILKIYISL